ncbi:MAG: uroporphyrinogen-III synthase [Bacteroidetes bacterium]|nr:uroporphyrinogen-III synthase [Bacteroidota bacterium]
MVAKKPVSKKVVAKKPVLKKAVPAKPAPKKAVTVKPVAKKVEIKKPVIKKVEVKTNKIIPVVVPKTLKNKETEKTVIAKKAEIKQPIVEDKKVGAIVTPAVVALPDSFRTVLISQPEPVGEKTPYHDLAKKCGLRFDFKPFLTVEGIPVKDFRKARINPGEYSAVIFNSRNAIDYFFKICEEMRVKMAQETKYFCASETIALYLQKYIQYRKRKVFYGDGSIDELKSILTKHKADEKFLLPCSTLGIGPFPEFLKKNGFVFTEAVMYKTVIAEFKKDFTHDMITFFNPEGVRAFLKNFPNFKQGSKLIGAFGEATQKLLEAEKLTIHARAPLGEIKSMSMAIEKLAGEVQARKKNKGH